MQILKRSAQYGGLGASLPQEAAPNPVAGAGNAIFKYIVRVLVAGVEIAGRAVPGLIHEISGQTGSIERQPIEA